MLALNALLVTIGSNLRLQEVLFLCAYPSDKYIAGEAVSYEEVKKAWTTTVAAGGPHEVSVMYGQFYEAVREVNQTLHDDKKIKVWLGDPPADPNSSMDYSYLTSPDRDAFFAETVLREILDRDKKALLIIGAGHFMSGGMSATVSELENSEPGQYNVKAFIDAYYPDKLFIIQNHWRLPKLACNEVLEARLKQWTPPHLTSLQNTLLANFLNSPECKVDNIWGELARAWGDAYLYLGKSDALTLSPLPGEPEKPYLEEMLRVAPELRGRE